MILLNLLPPKVRAAALLRKTLLAAGLAYAGAAGWLAWQWSLSHVRLVAAEHEVARVRAQLNSPELQVAVKAVQKFADDMAAVKARASVVNGLRKQQVPMLKILDSIPDWTMGGQVWFSSIEIDAGKGSQAVQLAGNAMTRSQFAHYYDFMGGQAGVQNLSLNGEPSTVFVGGMALIQFHLGFSVGGLP